jgi:MFS family permease
MPVVFGDDNRQCQIPEVTKMTTLFVTIGGLLSGLPSAFIAPFLGAYSDRHGRAKVLGITSLGTLMGEIITILVARRPDIFSVYWIQLGYFFEGLCGSFIASMAVSNAYVSDCTPPGKRAQAIGYIYGCVFTGMAIGPLISAELVKATGNILATFYLACAAHSLFVPFVLFVMPESLPLSRQLVAREKWQTRTTKFGVFKPLKILWPTGLGTSSVLRRNLSLIAAIDTSVFGVAMGAMSVSVLYSQQMFHWGHETTQIYVSVVNICRVTILMAGLPTINRLLRGKPDPNQKHAHTGADNIDLGLIRVGILFDLVGYIGYSASTHGTMFIISGALAAGGGIANPTLTSALTRHVPPDATGQLLGAIALLHALARIVSPVIFSGIFYGTVEGFPQTVFVCLASLFLIAEIMSWFVKPHGKF